MSDAWDLEVLGGLLLSKVAQLFIEAYCVRMRGGNPTVPSSVPTSDSSSRSDLVAENVASTLRDAFQSRDVNSATDAAVEAFGIQDLSQGTQLLANLDNRFGEAVQSFWDARDRQQQKQVEAGKIDAGTRGAVTGGTQMGALEHL